MKNPVRDLPRAIAISCSLCLVIYVFTIVAFHTILDKVFQSTEYVLAALHHPSK